MMQMRYDELRGRYPVFEYRAYHWEATDEGFKVWFDFRMGDVEFHPEALVERRPFLDFGVDVEPLVFDIGMVELVSYWKCACPQKVEVACGCLTEAQAAFWKKLYWNGLGEFFYTNGISETQKAFLRVESGEWRVESDATQFAPALFSTLRSPLSTQYLVPVGGGKDSVVTLELLRRAGMTVRPLIMNPRGATVGCARVAGFPMEEVLVIRRKIDPTLLELNRQGYLNGHTPFSAMLAFYTRLASALSGIPNVALSNESSANESTVLGTSVNHQYSKSLEFEDDFRRYVGGERLEVKGDNQGERLKVKGDNQGERLKVKGDNQGERLEVKGDNQGDNQGERLKVKGETTDVSHLSPFTSHLSPFTSHLSPFTSHLSPFTSHLSPFTSHLSPFTSHLSPSTSHLSPSTSHLSPSTSHLSPFTSHLSPFNYFSFLRPLSELQIAMLFSGMPQYHDVFRSCNVGSKEDVWCGHCAKCLFAYIILSPFIEPRRLNGIFGRAMLDDTTLLTEFRQLTGEAETKPFECVGTVAEVRTALSMAVERWYAGEERPALLSGFVGVPADERVPLHGLLAEGNLSGEERKILTECIEKSN